MIINTAVTAAVTAAVNGVTMYFVTRSINRMMQRFEDVKKNNKKEQ